MVLFRAIGYPFMPKQGSTAKYKVAKFKIWQGRVPKSPDAKYNYANTKSLLYIYIYIYICMRIYIYRERELYVLSYDLTLHAVSWYGVIRGSAAGIAY